MGVNCVCLCVYGGDFFMKKKFRFSLPHFPPHFSSIFPLHLHALARRTPH